MTQQRSKYIFVTGGVASALGKGITSASLGRLLRSRGWRVTMLKFDPYVNVDAGTMNPFQHGEVFVTDDGAETDMDLGHYERFIDENLSRDNNTTTGKIYAAVIARERRGEYLGATVQVIPHVTNEIRDEIVRVARTQGADIIIVEVGGTVGDIESLPFLEAIRQFKFHVGEENVMYVHVSLVPYLTGRSAAVPHEALFWRAEYHKAVRRGDWKLVKDEMSGRTVLFDLAADKSERRNLAPAHPEVVRDLEQALTRWENEMVSPLWPRVMDFRFVDGEEVYFFPL